MKGDNGNRASIPPLPPSTSSCILAALTIRVEAVLMCRFRKTPAAPQIDRSLPAKEL